MLSKDTISPKTLSASMDFSNKEENFPLNYPEAEPILQNPLEISLPNEALKKADSSPQNPVFQYPNPLVLE